VQGDAELRGCATGRHRDFIPIADGNKEHLVQVRGSGVVAERVDVQDRLPVENRIGGVSVLQIAVTLFQPIRVML
jgi:hypothetical protein